MSEETERLVKELKKELRVLRIKVNQKRDRELSKAYRELLSTLK